MRHLILFLIFSLFLFSCSKPEPRDKGKSVAERVADTHSEVTRTEPEGMSYYVLTRTDTVQIGHIVDLTVIAESPASAMTMAKERYGDLWSNEHVICDYMSSAESKKAQILYAGTKTLPCKCKCRRYCD